MIECKYRIPVNNANGRSGVVEAMDKAVQGVGLHGTVAMGKMKQTFDCGLCQLLTQNDIGPMECQQPDHDEKTCPDIAHLRQ